MALEGFHVTGLLAVEVFRGSNRNLHSQDRFEFLDRLGMRVIDGEKPEPLLKQLLILTPRKLKAIVELCGL